MKIIKQYYQIESPINRDEILSSIERAARTCYKSEDKAGTNASKFVAGLMSKNPPHESVIEHCSITVRFICDRGITHELVRHRLAAYSQESTRYCNYSNDKFGKELTFIDPEFLDEKQIFLWKTACSFAETYYLDMIQAGCTPQMARTVLPNSIKTEIVMTCNLREWRHVLKLRTSPAAHPQMRSLMTPLLDSFKQVLPEIFGDIQ